MNKSIKYISFICCFCLLLGTIITIVDSWCFNREFYAYEYDNLKTAESIGMSNEDLDKTTDVLLSYLKDRNLTLEVSANVKGKDRQVFNEREILHMEDVRDLYLNVIKVKNIAFIIFALTLVLIFVKKDFTYFYKEFKKALLVFLFIFSLIAIFCIIDFNSFWTNFHYVFFPDNDLWLLDPRTDILIMMVPEKFFFDLCTSIVFTIFLSMLMYLLIFKTLDKKVINK